MRTGDAEQEKQNPGSTIWNKPQAHEAGLTEAIATMAGKTIMFQDGR